LKRANLKGNYNKEIQLIFTRQVGVAICPTMKALQTLTVGWG